MISPTGSHGTRAPVPWPLFLLTPMLFGMPLDVIGTIGIILLIGMVKKSNPPSLPSTPRPHDTLCKLLGGVSLMLGTGTGSEIQQPLGYAIVGGLLVSQFLTLFTRPVVYIF